MRKQIAIIDSHENAHTHIPNERRRKKREEFKWIKKSPKRQTNCHYADIWCVERRAITERKNHRQHPISLSFWDRHRHAKDENDIARYHFGNCVWNVTVKRRPNCGPRLFIYIFLLFHLGSNLFDFRHRTCKEKRRKSTRNLFAWMLCA